MKALVVPVPKTLNLQSTVQFVCELKKLPEVEGYIFDFSQVGRIEPFAMLLLSSELQRLRSQKSKCDFAASNFEHCTYASHMGFFKAFGLDYGKSPGEATGSNRYIPITIFDVETIQKQALEKFEAVGDLIETQAGEMSKILTQKEYGDLYDTLTYSIREIIRNVIEHSNAEQFGFCAQYWPTYHSVELAILDRGIGIKSGLSTNPHLNIKNDHEAINLSLMPGISGKAYKGSKTPKNDVWANSGYGLYMTSRLCREGGSFFIASGSTGLYLCEKNRNYVEAPFQGTALKMQLNTSRLKSLSTMLSKYKEEAIHCDITNQYRVSASKASTMLARDFKNA